MRLPVADMVSRQQIENSGCILCGTCVDGCKQGAIRFTWRKIRLPEQTRE